MSIVYDYLKQIQAKKSPEKAVPEVPPAKKPFGYSLWGKVAAGVLGCVLLGAGLYFFPPKVEKTTVKLYQPQVRSPAPELKNTNDGYILEGIIYNPSKPFAIINGKMFEAGGRIGDFEVAEITPDTVLLKNLKDGTSRTIRL